VRTGRLGWLVAIAAVLALVAVATSSARVQRQHVVVVKGKGFRLLAWDATDRSKSLCVLAKAGRHSSSVCAQKLNALTGLQFTSFQDNAQTFTVVGGAARKSVAKVVALFADGKQLTIRTKRGTRYKGRRHGRVKFWAGRHKGSAPLRTLSAKTARGATLQTITVTPAPKPPQPCPPCGGPPRAQSGGRLVCPLALCPE
jgi:hypothetical protein